VPFHNVLGKFTLDTAFEVPAKGITALFGPSGCGKTTVIRCIAGLVRVKDGYFDIDGRSGRTAIGLSSPPTSDRSVMSFRKRASFHTFPCGTISFSAPHRKSPLIGQ
jgi:molybdate transport system ATP-binding protein